MNCLESGRYYWLPSFLEEGRRGGGEEEGGEEWWRRLRLAARLLCSLLAQLLRHAAMACGVWGRLVAGRGARAPRARMTGWIVADRGHRQWTRRDDTPPESSRAGRGRGVRSRNESGFTPAYGVQPDTRLGYSGWLSLALSSVTCVPTRERATGPARQVHYRIDSDHRTPFMVRRGSTVFIDQHRATSSGSE